MAKNFITAHRNGKNDDSSARGQTRSENSKSESKISVSNRENEVMAWETTKRKGINDNNGNKSTNNSASNRRKQGYQ